jgi:hypothetical protein
MQRCRPFLEQVARLMEPGGRLWILTPNASALAFLQTQNLWGWGVPMQHYQFLSQRVPTEYFTKLNLKQTLALDLQPATYHYPSYWQSQLDRVIFNVLNPRIRHSSGLSLVFLKGARRILWQTRPVFYGSRRWNLCPLERTWASISGRRPFDELMIVLEK